MASPSSGCDPEMGLDKFYFSMATVQMAPKYRIWTSDDPGCLAADIFRIRVGTGSESDPEVARVNEELLRNVGDTVIPLLRPAFEYFCGRKKVKVEKMAGLSANAAEESARIPFISAP